MKLLVGVWLVGVLGAGMTVAESISVYVGSSEKGIYRTELNGETGKLSKPVLAVEVERASFLVMDKAGKRLFSTAGTRGDDGKVSSDRVAGYAVQEDGSLKLQNYESSHGKGICFVGLDATEKVLLAANYGSGGVAIFPAQEDGGLYRSRSAHQHEGSSVNEARQKGPHAHSIYAGPENKFVYVPDLGIDEVVIYKMDAASAEMSRAGAAKMPPGSGPRHMKFGKDGKQAYVLAEMFLDVVVFDRNSKDGSLKQKEVVSVFLPDGDKKKMSCSEILVSGDGRFVYTANRDLAGQGRDSLSVLTVGEGGTLTHLQTVAAEVHIPRNINLSPDGKWLLVAGQVSGGVPTFKVGGDGKLEFSGNRAEVPKAMCVVFGK